MVQNIHQRLFAELEHNGVVHLRNPVHLAQLPLLLASYLPANQFITWLTLNKCKTVNAWHYSLVCIYRALRLPSVTSFCIQLAVDPGCSQRQLRQLVGQPFVPRSKNFHYPLIRT